VRPDLGEEMDTVRDDLLVFNGINATTGGYLLPPMSPERISKIALGQVFEPDHIAELRWRHHQSSDVFFGPKAGVDPKKQAEAGWGVIFAHDADPVIREALSELLEHRQREAAAVHERFYREFRGNQGYRPGESKQQFLARHGAGPGPADPEKMPYYLLIVGDPESIPYSFQYQLDVQHAVGRIHFGTAEEYANYAHSVVAADTAGFSRPRRITLFATQNPGDRATALSATELVMPLAENLTREHNDWAVESLVGEQATKQRLTDLLCSGNAPALLFTASHGLAFPLGHPRQRSHQGAVLCQDWWGPRDREVEIPEDCYVSADDIGADASPTALISFHFACFGGGTPEWEDFGHNGLGHRRRLAPHAFVAGLPQRLLGHPRGGALAVVGHIERAWGYSFVWPQAGRQTEVYASSLRRLLEGHPVGSAFEYFNERYAELSSDLTTLLDDVKYGARPDHMAISAMWTANNDARGLAILGDPAVRIRAAVPGPPALSAPEITIRQSPSAPTLIEAAPATPRPDGSGSDGGATGPHQRTTQSTDAGREPGGHAIVLDPPATPGQVGDELADLDYGVLDGVKRARERVIAALDHLAQSFGSALERAGEATAALEVTTYVADDLGSVRYDVATKRFEGPVTLRAFTRVEIDGDTQVLVAKQLLEGDQALWDLHRGMVEQARAARQDLLTTVTSAATGLIEALKIL
jgi:hypothetical protein